MPRSAELTQRLRAAVAPDASGEARRAFAQAWSDWVAQMTDPACPPEWVETAKVFDMLLAVPKYGRVKVNKILQQCRISPSKTIGGLSERQRTELVGMLRR